MIIFTVIAVVSLIGGSFVVIKAASRRKQLRVAILIAAALGAIISIALLFDMLGEWPVGIASSYLVIVDAFAIALVFCSSLALRSWNSALMLLPALVWIVFLLFIAASFIVTPYTLPMMG